MEPTTPSHNQRLKTKWVWDWLTQLPMHWGFEDSESSTGSGSDGSDSHIGDGDDEPASQQGAGGKGVLSTELIRKGRKRAFVEEEEGEKEVEIIDLTGDKEPEVRVVTGVVGRLVKRVRRSLGG